MFGNWKSSHVLLEVMTNIKLVIKNKSHFLLGYPFPHRHDYTTASMRDPTFKIFYF